MTEKAFKKVKLFLADLDDSDRVEIWSLMDIPEPKLEKVIQAHKVEAKCCAFNSAATQIATGGSDSNTKVFTLGPQSRSYTFQSHQGPVNSVVFSPDGQWFASASTDCTVRTWKPAMKGPMGSFRAHSSSVRCVDVNQSGDRLVTSSDDKTVKLWSAVDHRFLCSFSGHKNWVRSCRFLDDELIASCSDDKSVQIWHRGNKENCQKLETTSPLFALATASTGTSNLIAAGAQDGFIYFWDLRQSRNVLLKLEVHTKQVNALCFAANKNWLISASNDCTTKIISIQHQQPIYTLHSNSKVSINCVAVVQSHNTSRICAVDNNGQAFIWSTKLWPTPSTASSDQETVVKKIAGSYREDINIPVQRMTSTKERSAMPPPASLPESEIRRHVDDSSVFHQVNEFEGAASGPSLQHPTTTTNHDGVYRSNLYTGANSVFMPVGNLTNYQRPLTNDPDGSLSTEVINIATLTTNYPWSAKIEDLMDKTNGGDVGSDQGSDSSQNNRVWKSMNEILAQLEDTVLALHSLEESVNKSFSAVDNRLENFERRLTQLESRRENTDRPPRAQHVPRVRSISAHLRR